MICIYFILNKIKKKKIFAEKDKSIDHSTFGYTASEGVSVLKVNGIP